MTSAAPPTFGVLPPVTMDATIGYQFLYVRTIITACQDLMDRRHRLTALYDIDAGGLDPHFDYLPDALAVPLRQALRRAQNSPPPPPSPAPPPRPPRAPYQRSAGPMLRSDMALALRRATLSIDGRYYTRVRSAKAHHRIAGQDAPRSRTCGPQTPLNQGCAGGGMRGRIS